LTASWHYSDIRLESLGKTNRQLSKYIRIAQVRFERDTPRITDQSFSPTRAGSVQAKGAAAAEVISRLISECRLKVSASLPS
jgi:hypothetical protein